MRRSLIPWNLQQRRMGTVANCDIHSGKNLSNLTYEFRVNISIADTELEALDIGFLQKLSMALEANIDVSMKLSVMAELFRQLGR